MSRTVAIPWLWDRHSHVSLFAALPGCPSLDGLEPEAAMALLAGLPGDRVSAVTGWDDARLKLTRRSWRPCLRPSWPPRTCAVSP